MPGSQTSENFIYMKHKAKQMSTKKHVKCRSNILNVKMQREWTCSALDEFEPLEEGRMS